MEEVLQIPRITNTTVKYFVDGEFIDNVTVDEVNKIRENVLKYIINTKDFSILNRFYFIGHEDTNNVKMGEEVKMTMDKYGNFSAFPWEMSHVRRSMYRLMQIDHENNKILNDLNCEE